MKKNIIVGMMVALFCTSLLAQDLPMLRSKDALRIYALEQSANVAATINTTLPVGNNNYGFVQVESPTAEGISNTIRHINLAVDVANPNDYLYVWAGVYSSDGDILFTGNHQFKLENAKGGYVLPDSYGDVTLALYSEIPIKIEGAQSAQLTIQNENGGSQFATTLRVYNGKVYFPRQLAGTNAILSVSTFVGEKGDGINQKWLYWNVSNGSSIKAEHFTTTLKATIQGVVSVTDEANVWVAVPTTNGIGNNLTVEFKSTGKALIGASFYTTEGKWFTGAWVRKAGTSDWLPYKATIGEKAVFINVPMQQGIYYIVPTWNSGDLTEPTDNYYPPYSDDKG